LKETDDLMESNCKNDVVFVLASGHGTSCWKNSHLHLNKTTFSVTALDIFCIEVALA